MAAEGTFIRVAAVWQGTISFGFEMYVGRAWQRNIYSEMKFSVKCTAEKAHSATLSHFLKEFLSFRADSGRQRQYFGINSHCSNFNKIFRRVYHHLDLFELWSICRVT
jgi:hypothetical protein